MNEWNVINLPTQNIQRSSLCSDRAVSYNFPGICTISFLSKYTWRTYISIIGAERLPSLLRELSTFEFCANCVPAKERNDTEGCCNSNESCTQDRCRRPNDRYDIIGKLGCRDSRRIKLYNIKLCLIILIWKWNVEVLEIKGNSERDSSGTDSNRVPLCENVGHCGWNFLWPNWGNSWLCKSLSLKFVFWLCFAQKMQKS